MRVTVDLRNLNKALQDTHLPIPRVDDIMSMFTGNIPNAAVIQDEIVVATADKETHYQTLEAVITALEKAGLTVSPSKSILGQPEIPFWGI